MYQLYDLAYDAKNRLMDRDWPTNPMVFDTKSDLLDFWKRKIGDFRELNVTGKDNKIENEYTTTTSCVPGLLGYTTIEHRVLKRYLVIDESGRHMDIREWENTPIRTGSTHTCAVVPFIGEKYHLHRTDGPSMYRRTRRANTDDRFEELENGEMVAVPGIRSKTVIRADDVWEHYGRPTKGVCSKSWKDQTKADRQYRQRKKGSTRSVQQGTNTEDMTWVNLERDGFPVSAAAFA